MRKSKSQQKAPPTRNVSRMYGKSRGVSFDRSMLVDKSGVAAVAANNHISHSNMFDFPFANFMNNTGAIERSFLEQTGGAFEQSGPQETTHQRDNSRNHAINYVNSAGSVTNVKDIKSYRYLVKNLTRNLPPEEIAMMQQPTDGDPGDPIYKQEFSLITGSVMMDPAHIKSAEKFA